jgi:hypothetical protein
MKICREAQNFAKIGQKYLALCLKTEVHFIVAAIKALYASEWCVPRS